MIGGLDLGRVKDPTALVLGDRDARSRYVLSSIAEWRPEREDFSDVVDRVNASGAAAVAFDAAGKKVGMRFQPLMTADAAMPVFPVVASHQRKPTEQKWGTNPRGGDYGGVIFVPKVELVSVYFSVLRDHRLVCDPELPLAWKLREEMRLYTHRQDAYGYTSWGVFASGYHDDIVSALQLLLWLGERGHAFRPANERRSA